MVCHESNPAGANTGEIALAADAYADFSTGTSPNE